MQYYLLSCRLLLFTGKEKKKMKPEVFLCLQDLSSAEAHVMNSNNYPILRREPRVVRSLGIQVAWTHERLCGGEYQQLVNLNELEEKIV